VLQFAKSKQASHARYMQSWDIRVDLFSKAAGACTQRPHALVDTANSQRQERKVMPYKPNQRQTLILIELFDIHNSKGKMAAFNANIR